MTALDDATRCRPLHPMGISTSRGLGVLALALALAAVPHATSAQDPSAGPDDPGGAAYRHSLGVSVLFPGAPGTEGAPDESRLPSARATFSYQVSPRFGINVGGLRLAPPGTTLWAGIGGLEFALVWGGVRVSPFVEGGGGSMEAVVQVPAYTYVDENGLEQTEFVPEHKTESTFGGGAGLDLEIVLGGGVTLEAIGGYYHFPASFEAGLSGPYFGGGLRLAIRDEPWYWRSSGLDRTPPELVRIAPDADDEGVLDVGRGGLEIVATDASEIESIIVAGQQLDLTEIPLGGEPGGEPPRLGALAHAPLGLPPGTTLDTVALTIRDRAGNETTRTVLVRGPPADSSAPILTVQSPSSGAVLATETVTVTGTLTDANSIDSVVVNGVRATVLSSDPSGEADRNIQVGPRDEEQLTYEFRANVPLELGRNRLDIVASDSEGNTAITEHVAIRRVTVAGGREQERGPEILIEVPLEWSGAGTRGISVSARRSVRVVGVARDEAGVREIRVDGQLASMQRLDERGEVVRFIGYAPVENVTQSVEIAAWSRDGQVSARLFEAVVDPSAVDPEYASGFRGERFAVVIGVGDYADPKIPDLDYADDDAEAVYDFLRSERAGGGGIPEENIVALLNEEATYREVRSALFTFLQRATETDIVYIYIAGHGTPDPNRIDDLYFLPYDAEAEDIPGTGMRMSDINEAIGRLYARHTVLITDACHSGGVGFGEYAMRAAGDGDLNAINRVFLEDLQSVRGGLAIFTASEARQLSREGRQWGGGHGVFTYYLLQGLEGEADADGDQIVRLGELMEYVRDRVRRETNNGQIPSIGSQSHDRFLPVSVVLEPAS